MITDTSLLVIDLRTPPTTKYQLSTAQDAIIERLAPIMREGYGTLDSQLCFNLERLPVGDSLYGLPGTAFGFSSPMRTHQPLIGGVRFSISTACESISEAPVLLAWVVWEPAVASEAWNQVMEKIDKNADGLREAGLYPQISQPKPDCLPWLAILRMPLWRKLSEDKRPELTTATLSVAWSAIVMLSNQ